MLQKGSEYILKDKKKKKQKSEKAFTLTELYTMEESEKEKQRKNPLLAIFSKISGLWTDDFEKASKEEIAKENFYRQTYKKIVIMSAAFTFPLSVILYGNLNVSAESFMKINAFIPHYKKVSIVSKAKKGGPEKAVGLSTYFVYKRDPVARQEELISQTVYTGPRLSRSRGSVMGPSGKETYYNMNMTGVVNIMRRMGNNDKYWVRSDGAKMLGDYIMVAANLHLRPRGSHVMTSLGKAVVADTGGFAAHNPRQIDVATTW